MAVDRNLLADLRKTLSLLQEKVVRLYFGLGCLRSHAASEIAQEFHVSPQVIGGILSGAQRKLGKLGWTASELRQASGANHATNAVPGQRGKTCRHRRGGASAGTGAEHELVVGQPDKEMKGQIK